MSKKVLSLFLALVLVLGCLPMAASAVESGNCGAEGNESGVTWKIEGGTLTISGSGAMADYFAPGPMGNFEEDQDPAPWYPGDGITKIVVEEGVTSVGNNTFRYCPSATSVTLPSSLTRIGESAFFGCDLASIVIPNTVTSIGDTAFSSCGLASVTIPASVTSIGNCAFANCSNLTEFTVIEENSNYTSDNGVLFNKGKTELICYPVKKSGTQYEIPDSVTSIGEASFSGCTSLTDITIPDGVTSIESGAFSGCTGLTSMTIPDGVTSIGNSAFSGCTKLTNITIPDSVTTIGNSAFWGCSKLTGITFPDGLISIGGLAFSGCSGLTELTFPASLTTLGGGAFYSTGVKTAIFEGNAPTITGDAPPITGGSEFCKIYYKDGATGWTTPTWNGNGIDYPCKPVSEMEPDKPSKPSTPSTPSGDTDDDPIVETDTTANGDVVTTTTQPNGDKELKVETPTGKTIAEITLPADPGAGKQFEDVSAGAWYAGAVDKATAYGLFGGASATIFEPGGSMTRGMVAQTLYNLSGKPGYGVGEGNFFDVAAGKWYENAIAWAAKAEVVSGTGNGNFSPEQSVTREQLVTMLYNYAKVIGADTTPAAGLDSFPDGDSVSNYAQTPMKWAVAKGFLSGRAQNGKNYIAPVGTATRAEVAAILSKFVESLK